MKGGEKKNKKSHVSILTIFYLSEAFYSLR